MDIIGRKGNGQIPYNIVLREVQDPPKGNRLREFNDVAGITDAVSVTRTNAKIRACQDTDNLLDYLVEQYMQTHYQKSY